MSATFSLTVEDVAESLQHIAEKFGIDVARELVRHFGGTKVYVPKVLPEGHALYALGEDLAQQLCGEFGGAFMVVPKDAVSNPAKHRLAHAMDKSGTMKVAEIARALNLTERAVYKLLAGQPSTRRGRKPVDPRQITMMDWLDRG